VVVDRPELATPRRAIDPMSTPGIRSADLVGLSPWAGSVTEQVPPSPSKAVQVSLDDVDLGEAPVIALADAYSLRVVATRRLYDRGAAVLASPALVALQETTSAHANPYDLDRLGVTTGDVVRVVTARGVTELPVTTDPLVVRGTVELAFNTVASGRDVVGELIVDDAAPVVEIRLESR
jgi:anaerobic selenocysteine-containing dehydrogenase